MLAMAVTAFAALTTGVGSASGAPALFLVLDGTLGLTFVACGLAAASLRPGSPAGPILMVSGVLWFIGSYAPTGQPVLTHLGFAFERYYDLALAVLLLLVSGGVGGRIRWVLVVLAAAMAARTVGRLLLQDPVRDFPDCVDCPANPFALWPDPGLFVNAEVVANTAMAVLFLMIGLVAAGRLVGSGPIARRIGWPILVAGTFAVAGAAYDAAEYAYTTATNTPLFEPAEPWATIFEWSVFGARALVPVGFLVATLRNRRQAGPLGPLAAELERTGGPGGIGDALRKALGDPSLQILRHVNGGWLSETGAPATLLPPPGPRRTVSMIGTTEDPLAAIVHDPALTEQPELLGGVIRVLVLAFENERLQSDLREQLQLVTESRTRLVSAAEAERRRLERDLHDGAQQRLIAVMLALQQARAEAGDAAAPAEVAQRLDAAADELNSAIRELRELARGIHPAILEDEGLAAAVAGLARRAGLPVSVRVDLGGRLPPLIESTAYFTIAEVLTNAQRHARATQAEVRVTHVDGVLEVEVHDDGAGGADPSRGSGLRGLADRVTALGGRLHVESATGGGTTVHASIPVP